jgi:hypothetical protein
VKQQPLSGDSAANITFDPIMTQTHDLQQLSSYHYEQQPKISKTLFDQ